MSLEKFITDILNIKSEKIEKLTSIDLHDNSILIKVRLKRDHEIKCPLCKNEKVKIHGYSKRTLIL